MCNEPGTVNVEYVLQKELRFQPGVMGIQGLMFKQLSLCFKPAFSDVLTRAQGIFQQSMLLIIIAQGS
jgi:hypothetical protein